MISPEMKGYIEKEYKELTDHFHDATERKDSLEIWYYTGALMELAYLKDFVGYEEGGITRIPPELPSNQNVDADTPMIGSEELEIL
jgi:hypothetical protein